MMRNTLRFASLAVALAIGLPTANAQVGKGGKYISNNGSPSSIVSLFGFPSPGATNQDVLGAGVVRQTDQGFSGADRGFNYGSFGLSAQAGLFVSDHVAVGLGVNLIVFDDIVLGQVSPELTYFFNPATEGLNFYSSLSGTYLGVEDADFISGTVAVGALKRLPGNVAFQVEAQYARLRLVGDEARLGNDRFVSNVFALTGTILAYFDATTRDGDQGSQNTLGLTKGTWITGAQGFSLSYVPDEDANTFTVGAQAAGLYMLSPRFGLGANLGYGLTRTRYEFFGEDQTDVNNSLSVQPTFRTYFTPEKRVSFLLEVGVVGDLSASKFERLGETFSRRSNGFGFQFFPAYAVAIGQRVSLEFGPELRYVGYGDDDFNVLSVRAQAGIVYAIGGQKSAE